MKKYLPLLITILGVGSTIFSQTVQSFWAHHPETVAVIAGAWASVKWLLPSPIQK